MIKTLSLDYDFLDGFVFFSIQILLFDFLKTSKQLYRPPSYPNKKDI
jgi:hypothetical protein